GTRRVLGERHAIERQPRLPAECGDAASGSGGDVAFKPRIDGDEARPAGESDPRPIGSAVVGDMDLFESHRAAGRENRSTGLARYAAVAQREVAQREEPA